MAAPMCDDVLKSTENNNLVFNETTKEDKRNLLAQNDKIHALSRQCLFQKGKAGSSTWSSATKELVRKSDIKKEKEVSSKHVLLRSEQDLAEVEVLGQLSPLNQASVLCCLRCRSQRSHVYTAAGNTTVAVNPFKDIPHIYTSDVILAYHNQDRQSPHIYSVAERARRSVQGDVEPINQSVIVSGESGAGKTVTAKHLIKYLVTVSKKGSDSTPGVGGRIERRILDSNPILEAFGNACTTRNKNSSRFGKFIQLQFHRSGQLEGAKIQTYLLEKTRVIHQGAAEYNFHIFYQILAGAGYNLVAWQDIFGVEPPTVNHYLIADKTGRNEEDDLANWHITQEAMLDIGLDRGQQQQIFQLLLAVLCIGNISIEENPEDDEVCDVDTDSKEMSEMCEIATIILGIEQSQMERYFTHRRIAASHSRRQSVFYRPCTQQQAISRRDCLAMLLYSRLFEWLVTFINGCIQTSMCSRFIGILDIYGFESFVENSLEQLCINYANERMQQHYVTHFLRDLQADYEQEAIDWQPLSFNDNRACVDLLDGNLSIFSLLNEECSLNRPSNTEVLSQRLVAGFETNCYFTRMAPNVQHTQFGVKHYAEPVNYIVDKLVEKNKDDVPAELINLLQSSTVPFIAELFDDLQADSSGKRKKTLLAKFKGSLDGLLSSLHDTQPHYIRCIKPNRQCLPHQFDGAYVLKQLQACGVVETVEICQQGYPARLTYEMFLRKYGIILRVQPPAEERVDNKLTKTSNKENELFYEPLDVLYKKQLQFTPRRRQSTTPKKQLRRRAEETELSLNNQGLSSGDHTRKLCAAIMTTVFESHYKENPALYKQFGRHKIFLKSGQLEVLESNRTNILTSKAFTIQCAWRSYIRRRRRRHLLATVIIQSAYRGWRERLALHHAHKAASLIQVWYRRHLVRQTKLKSYAPVVANGTPSLFSTPEHILCVEEEPRMLMVTPKLLKQVSGTSLREECHLPASYLQLGLGSPASPRSVESPVNQKYMMHQEKEADSMTYHVMPTEGDDGYPSRRLLDMFRIVSASISAAYVSNSRFQLAGAFSGIPYLEAKEGVVSRRRMPRVQVKFHTRPNRLLPYGHFISQRELQCSLDDCLLDANT